MAELKFARAGPSLSAFRTATHWPGLRTLVKIRRERRRPGQSPRVEAAFSLWFSPTEARHAPTPAQGRLENGGQWVLAGAFRQDDTRVRPAPVPKTSPSCVSSPSISSTRQSPPNSASKPPRVKPICLKFYASSLSLFSSNCPADFRPIEFSATITIRHLFRL